jgi:hypothetical protein
LEIGARQRVRAALDAVGPEFAGLMVDVCCFLKWLEQVESERSWPPRSAKVVLQLGLDGWRDTMASPRRPAAIAKPRCGPGWRMMSSSW